MPVVRKRTIGFGGPKGPKSIGDVIITENQYTWMKLLQFLLTYGSRVVECNRRETHQIDLYFRRQCYFAT